jgi:streptogramin lyase
MSSRTQVAFLLSLFLGACTTETSSSSSGGPSPDPGSCGATGSGTVSVVVRGLPAGVDANVTLTGRDGGLPITASGDRVLGAGAYTATAARVTKADPIVRTVYEPTVDATNFCLEGSKTQTVTITYAEIASSNKLWATNANNPSGELLGFASSTLGATGSPAASVATKGPGSKAIAFDKNGNMWSLGGTTTDAGLARFAASSLGASGTSAPDRKLSPKLSGCVPALSAIAFDPSGALWATSSCDDRVLRIGPSDLDTAEREYTPAASDFTTSTLDGPRAVAFDREGNMWVSDNTSLHRFAAASLAADQPHTSSFAITLKNGSGGDLPPDALAFDGDGNLWVTSFGGNLILKLTPADLAVSGSAKDVTPSVSITVGVTALLESLAFDESGGLWLTYSQGKIARLAPAQLGTSTTAGAPTLPERVITSADIGYAGGMAFFPAPDRTPLYGK